MLIDTFNRKIDYIRVSLTKQCNFRCSYCMPDTPIDFNDNSNLLPLDDLLEFLKVGIDEGIRKIRITGGEPLLREGLCEFIKKLNNYNSDIDIALTTNAFLLEKLAVRLKEAGLKRINISLDTLDKERFKKISKRDGLENVIAGIDSAINLGMRVKINCVPIKGVNDDEIISLLEFAINRGVMIRFIEFMENSHAKDGLKGLNNKEIQEIIAKKYKFHEIIKDNMGPAKIYKLENQNTNMIFGIIAPHEDDFCKSCNRIRLSSDGVICPCLYYQDSLDVNEVIRSKNKNEMKKALHLGVFKKPEKNQWNEDMNIEDISARAFYYTGG